MPPLVTARAFAPYPLKPSRGLKYTVGGFNFAIFSEKLKIMQIKFIEQLNQCSYNEFLINLDTFMSNIPQAVAGFSNLGTQIGVGWEKSDTSVFIGLNKVKDGWNNDKNWETIGGGMQLLASELLKVAADATQIDVTPTNLD